MEHEFTNPINREQVFEWLAELGIEVVRVPYHGAHDESFVEAAELYANDPTGTAETPKYVLGEGSIFGQSGRGRGPDPEGPEELGAEGEDALREVLEEPIYEQLGEAFGDSVDGVDGVAVWKVPERRVVIEHGYLDWRTEELEV